MATKHARATQSDSQQTEKDRPGRRRSWRSRSFIGEGLSTSEIASRLHRSVKTIEWHRASLGTKLKAANRVELARHAIKLGLVKDPSKLRIPAM